MDTKILSNHRLFLSLAVICFLLFQITLIRSNIRYGSQFAASSSSIAHLPNPSTQYFVIDPVSPSHTFQDGKYYALGDTDPSSNLSLGLIELLFDSSNDAIIADRFVSNLSIPVSSNYFGLYFFNQTLWTLGGGDKTSTSSSLVELYQFDLDGIILDQFPLADSSGLDFESIQLVHINQSHATMLLTRRQANSALLHYNFQSSTTSISAIATTHRGGVAHVDQGLLWLLYNNLPAGSTQHDGMEEDRIPFLGGIPFADSQLSFARTYQVGEIKNGVYTRTISDGQSESDFEIAGYLTHLIAEGDVILRPVNVLGRGDTSTQFFFGVEKYTLKSRFLSGVKVLFLAGSIFNLGVSGWLQLTADPKRNQVKSPKMMS